MKKLFITTFVFLLLILGGLLFLQSRSSKEQIAHILQEMALQAGIRLTIGKIEGELPLQWTFFDVHAILDGGSSIHIDHLQVRIALLPLLRKHISISYLQADHTQFVYVPSSSPSSRSTSLPALKASYSIRSAYFQEILCIHALTQQQMAYSLKGKGGIVRGGKSFFVQASLHSQNLDLSLLCEGNKKLNHLQTALSLAVRSGDVAAPFYRLPFDTVFEAQSHAEGSWKTWRALLTGNNKTLSDALSGSLEIDLEKLALPHAHYDSLQLSSKFLLFGDKSWDLTQVSILSPFVQLQGSASFNAQGVPKKIETAVTLPDLSYLSSELKGAAYGELSLSNHQCTLSLTTPEFTAHQTTFQQAALQLQAHIQEAQWIGSLRMKAEHPTLGYEASSKMTWTPQQETFAIQSLDLLSPSGRLTGDLKIQGRHFAVGGILFQIKDLSAFSELFQLDLAGQIGGEIQLEGAEMALHAIGKNFKLTSFLSNHVSIDVEHLKLKSPHEFSFKFQSGKAYWREMYFTSFSYEMGWNSGTWIYDLGAKGDWKGPFDLVSQGTLKLSPTNVAPTELELDCHTFKGMLLNKALSLQNNCRVKVGKENFTIDTFDMTIDQGQCTLFASLDANQAMVNLQAHHFPLDFLTIFSPRFSLKGLSSLDVDLQGKPHHLVGHVNLLLEHADIYPAGNVKPIQTKGALQAHIAQNKLQVHTHLVATGQQLCDVSITLPFQFDLNPLHFSIPDHLPIAGECTIEGHTEQLFDFINLGSQRIGGFVSTRLLLSGTLASPFLHGPLTVQGGFYENYFIGITVKEADVKATATGQQLIIEKALATDGEKGTSESRGIFHLTRNLPFSIHGEIHHFRVIQFDWLTGACSGPFTINGDLTKALAKGKLSVDEAAVNIPDQLPSELPTLPITFMNEPPSYFMKFNYSEPYPFRYDIEIQGDHDLRLSGRGIEADLEGHIHMTGENLSVIANGSLHTKKGGFSFAGKDFIINQGEILFSEGKNFLNITSTVEYPGLTITVHFRGNLRSPQLIFESNPSLPTSSILARILFNKEVSELSAGQAVQLASTIVTLAGNSGPNVLESIRKSLGIDRLWIATNEETGIVSVQIGKYITQGVMISLIQSTQSSQVKVEVELKAGFVLEAETQEDNQGKFSFKWNKNY